MLIDAQRARAWTINKKEAVHASAAAVRVDQNIDRL
jgi:hypothetical protein